MLLKAAIGAHLFEEDSDECLTSEKSMDITGTIGTNRTSLVFSTDTVCLCSQICKTYVAVVD